MVLIAFIPDVAVTTPVQILAMFLFQKLIRFIQIKSVRLKRS